MFENPKLAITYHHKIIINTYYQTDPREFYSPYPFFLRSLHHTMFGYEMNHDKTIKTAVMTQRIF